MPGILKSEEAVHYRDILASDTVEREALLSLLERRVIITKAELLEEIKRLRTNPQRPKNRLPSQ
jgi:hypothetical protein